MVNKTIEKVVVQIFGANKKAVKKDFLNRLVFKWSHLGLNQGPPDYESDALTY